VQKFLLTLVRIVHQVRRRGQQLPLLLQAHHSRTAQTDHGRRALGAEEQAAGQAVHIHAGEGYLEAIRTRVSFFLNPSLQPLALLFLFILVVVAMMAYVEARLRFASL